MAKGLDKQVYIFSLDTSAFYFDQENNIHIKLIKLYRIKDSLNNKLKELKESNDSVSDEKSKVRQKKLKAAKSKCVKRINELKSELTSLISNNAEIRTLRNDALKENKIIGMFDSALTRTIGMKTNETSTEMFVVRVYYYQLLKGLIEDGFFFNGEKYIYFSSSAGQIRTKKGVFIKESTWLQHQGALTCGLTLDEINEKGGCNVNKLLAYKALTASASIEWKDFDIDKTIVVPDLETNVTAMFDYIDRDTYEITPQEMSVPIEHTDGCGMILPKKSKKSFMVRLPYVKGLLVPFAFDKFAEKFGSTKVKDIYGKEWDIIDDNIQVIFTASQFKMKKYYDGWDDYKKRFKKHKCQAVKLNEEDIGENATLNYQMLQTLTDITDKELKALAQPTIDDILKLDSDKETMLRILGATKTNKQKNYYQQALFMYPEMLNDPHSKKIIKDKKKSMVTDARAGKLRINGKYTYIVPDLYAFCERLFLNEVHPKGLLKDGFVHCSIYDEGKIDILRSPHLYKEHSIRRNIHTDETKEWFITKGIYTSIFDPISRVLQFDNDGDKVLVIQDDLFVKIAERNMEGILPLFYEMGSAKAENITNTKIFDSLLLAFKANIGEVSNNITKVLNSDNIDLRVVKWLTAESNFTIDFAKTLYMPTRPEWVDKIIKGYIKSKVPHFFIEAKGKEKKNVEPINSSTVNRLRKVIPNRRIKFEDVAGEFDYKNLMSDEVIRLEQPIVKAYEKLDRSKKWISQTTESGKSNKKMFVYGKIREEISTLHPEEDKIVNNLVEYLYNRKDSSFKDTLWWSFGDIILSNIRFNLKGTRQCENCGERIELINNKKKYCDPCSVEVNRIKTKENLRIRRGIV
ncbi:hypothetical protein Q9R36_07360 [Bacillus sp. AG4(2022)]|nr:hypothetical protein [Bacillus sp. AG4(2022)]MDT0160291.1 hypothetical protein [Bacillus sp. AG4(2022)]